MSLKTLIFYFRFDPNVKNRFMNENGLFGYIMNGFV